MIDTGTIQRIMDAAEITEVVQDFVSLKKRGVNYIGLCPFHNERTPSFSVSPSKGLFKCFGCGKGGNSVHFVMEHEKMGYPDALRYLARKYHITITEREETQEDVQKRNERESFLVINSFARKYFTEIVHNHPEGKSVGLTYLRERGLRDDIINRFELGYCLDHRDAFTTEALRNGYSIEYLEKTGLTIRKTDYNLDRFAARVIFPIHNLSGQVIAFGGRTLKNDKKTAKYVNSPESEIYHKSDVLYGIFQAKKGIVQHDKCYLVEGYLDVISMHQAGIENTVASSGTSLTQGQIRLIKRFTNNLTILYDGDAAGIKASLRGIDMVLEEGMNVRVLLFPDGHDPDSFSRQNTADNLARYIADNEQDFISFKTNILSNDAANDPVKRAQMISDIVRSVSVVPDAVVRSVYVQKCAQLLQTDEKMLHSEVNKARWQRLREKGANVPEPTNESVIAITPRPTNQMQSDVLSPERIENEIIRVLMKYGQNIFVPEGGEEQVMVSEYIVSEITSDDLFFSNTVYMRVFEACKNNLTAGEDFFIRHDDAEISRLAAELLHSNYQLSNIWTRGENLIRTTEINLSESVPKLLLNFKDIQIRLLLKQTEQAISKTKNSEELRTLMTQYKHLKEINIQLSKVLGNRIII